jgi:glucosyl-dolichyl phosphate glucuronosyltransferase
MNASIIICTRNRADSLAKTLAALERVAVPAGLQTEILVVDNGSSDHTAEVARKHPARRHPVRYISEPATGQSRARNTGLAAASSELILFTDDDVAPAGDWLEKITAPLVRGESEGVVGRIDLAEDRRRPWMTPQHLVSMAVYQGEPVQLIGANMGFHCSVLKRVPTFDVEVGPGAAGFGDDTLFSWQLAEAGFRLKYIPEASVLHYPDLSRLIRSSWLSTGRKHGASLAYLMHHWQHEDLPSPRLRAGYVALKLRLRRLLKPPVVLEAEGIDGWEMSYVSELEKCRQFLIERRRPRNYAKRGLRKLNPGREGGAPAEGKPLNPLGMTSP